MESENVQVQVEVEAALKTNELNILNVCRNVKKCRTIILLASIYRCFVALQQLKSSTLFLLILNIRCCTHSVLLPVQAAPSPTLHNSNSFTSETHSYDHAWPPNLPHIDIWNAVELPTDMAERVPAIESGMLQLHAKEAFQYVGTKFDAPALNIETTAAGDAEADELIAGTAEFNRTQLQLKLSGKQQRGTSMETIEKHLENKTILDVPNNHRQNRVIHLFPVPVDGECLSDDGRRIGNCFNAYECHAKGGIAKGECAMGFGVCCVFIASCNSTISNNITYLVSPQFPSFMPSNYSVPCNFKIELIDNEVSQLRIDFYHFSMGQPNRRTGSCDGDVFAVNGGPSGELTLCGQNSGQHVYYEVGGAAAPRQTLFGTLRPLTFSQLYPNSNASAMPLIEISMNFTQRFQPIRLWEIRIAQIPFSQRAPVGCLQYHTGSDGIVQTFNFAENGRHLANQNYRICMRQEQEMCSIMYQPCDEQSFRIGPSSTTNPGMLNMGAPALMLDPMLAGVMGSMMGGAAAGAGGSDNPALEAMPTMPAPVLADDPNMMQMIDAATTMSAMMSSAVSPEATTTSAAAAMDSTAMAAADSSAAPMSTETASSGAAPASSTEVSSAAPAATEMPTGSSQSPASSSSSATTLDTRSSTTPATSSSTTLNDEIADEGSGDGNEDLLGGAPTRRPGPVRGGFDLFGFLRSAFDFNTFRRSGRRIGANIESDGTIGTPRNARQLYSRCTDRLTMPCIVEDFIGMSPLGSPTLPGCEPVHCGSQFCSSGAWPCRIESTVTPFYIGVHFGSGAGKGSAEDNIGACLRYQQVECV